MKLTELFNSFQGEGAYTGYPMTFIRVTGCPVACPFCDTDYTYGEQRTFDEILDQVTHSHVCVTGGEPLVHPEIEDLLEALMHKRGVHMIHIETSGCYELPNIIWSARKFFWITVSPKGEFLGAKKNFRPSVIEDADEVKWIVPGTPIDMIEKFKDVCPNTYIQPVNSKLTIDDKSLEVASALAAKLNLPLSIQVHKLLNWR
jgi:organic radical activating enzyme